MQMFYAKEGHGDNLVFIHGWMTTRHAWASVIAHLKSDFRCHTLDLPGHGDSLKTACSLRDPNETLSQVRAMTPTDAVWVGWSLGGLLGLLAMQQTSPPRALICLGMGWRFVAVADWPCGVPAAEYDDFVHRFDLSPERTAGQFSQRLAQGDERAPQIKKDLFAMVNAPNNPKELRYGLDFLATDLRPNIHRVTRPILFVSGDSDRVVSPDNARCSANLLPEIATFRQVKNAGHALCLSHPRTLAKIITRFAHDVRDQRDQHAQRDQQ